MTGPPPFSHVRVRERIALQGLAAAPHQEALVVAELSRLGQSLRECMEILALATRKGIRVYSVKGNGQRDPRIQSKVIALAFSRAAEIERDLTSPRTQETLHFKKEPGMHGDGPRGRARASGMPSAPKSRAC